MHDDDARVDKEAAAPLAPGEQRDAPLFAASTRALARRAALAWLALALWLAGLQAVVLAELPAPLALATRLGELALPSAMFLVAPVLVIAPAFWIVRRQWAFGVELGCNLGLIAFMALAAAWAGVGIVYAVEGTDPWEHMPWVTPPYLERFIAAHPEIEVHKLNGVRELHLRHRTEGGWMRVDGNLLPGAQARFERCGAAPTADDLGGLPLPPGATCERVLTLSRAGVQRVLYQFELAPTFEREALARYYTAWADANELQAGFSGGASRYEFRAEQGDRQWDFWLSKRTGMAGALYVERGGRAFAWSDDGSAEGN